MSAGGVPIRTLLVEVTGGPDAGKRATAAHERLSIGTATGNDLVLSDPTVSRYHLELTAEGRGVLVTDLGSRNGTFFGPVRVLSAVIPPGATLIVGQSTLAVTEGADVQVEVLGADVLGRLRGSSPAMRRLMAEIQKLAQSTVSVLLVGESGTGKELIAEALHELGPKSREPFVTVDCGALSPTLVASELFGHERGAFTGADRQHIGAFERAKGGTLFLDEVGELPKALQATLLGVLERKSFRRLGGTASVESNARIIAATHRDLRAAVNDDTFRLDLYYRIGAVSLSVPTLRERPDDIRPLVEHFLRQSGHQAPLSSLISDQAFQTLMEHRWPGNVRELRNWVDATLALGAAQAVGAAPTSSDKGDPIGALLDLTWKDARGQLLAAFETRYLGRLLERTGGNVSKASQVAEMDRSHLRELLRRRGVR